MANLCWGNGYLWPSAIVSSMLGSNIAGRIIQHFFSCNFSFSKGMVIVQPSMFDYQKESTVKLKMDAFPTYVGSTQS